MQEQDVQQEPEQTEAQCERAADRVPGSSLVEMHQAHQERRADCPRGRGEQRAELQQQQSAEQSRERADLTCEQSHAYGDVV